MLTVLISDDEPDVCQLIIHLIEWDKKNLKLAGIASNGIECLEKIKACRPDIVITDIRMPGLNGLDLVREAREAGIMPHFIIISGYQEFKYAQQAIRYGVADYLLKPIGKRELGRCLDRIIHKIYADQAEASVFRQKEDLYQKNRRQMEKHLIAVLRHQPESCQNMTVQEINEQYHTQFEDGVFRAVCMKINSEEEGQEELIRQHLQSMEKIADRMFTGQRIRQAMAAEDQCLFGVIGYKAQEESSVGMVLETIYKTCLLYIKNVPGMTLVCTVSGRGGEPEKFSEMLDEAWKIRLYQMVLPQEQIIYADRLITADVNLDQIYPPMLRHTAEGAAAALDEEKMSRVIDQVFLNFREHRNGNPEVLDRFSEALVGLIERSLENSRIEMKLSDSSLFTEGAQNLQDLKVCMKTRAADVFRRIREASRYYDNRPIRIAKQYIKDHYREPVHLSEVAQLVHMNPAYFSSLFKKEAGISFSDYITEVRLNAAKKLLKNGDLTIREVAEHVGYTEVAYFSRIFTKRVGIKPSQYRKLHF